MKKLIITFVAFFLVGCATLKVTTPTGYTLDYSRIGDQMINASVMKNPKTSEVEINIYQKSDANALAEAIRIIGVLAVP